MTSNKEAKPFVTATPELQGSQGDNRDSRQEQEEKQILAAWKSMSSVLQQHSLAEDSRGPALAQSFLARQRKSTQARQALSPQLQPR